MWTRWTGPRRPLVSAPGDWRRMVWSKMKIFEAPVLTMCY